MSSGMGIVACAGVSRCAAADGRAAATGRLGLVLPTKTIDGAHDHACALGRRRSVAVNLKFTKHIPILERFKLWHAADSLCSFPGCPVDLAKLAFDDDLTPAIPHIISPAPQGPRANRRYPSHKLNTYDNLILLCDRHHRIIDKRPVTKYTAESILKMKATHETTVARQRQFGRSWSGLMGSLLYANVPRLFIDFGGSIMQSGDTVSTELPSTRIADLGIHRMHEYSLLLRSSLERNTKDATPLSPRFHFTNDMIGRRFIWWRKIRGKNAYNRLGKPKPITGILERDPQISFKDGGRKIIMPIDPIYALTSTGKIMLNGANYTPELFGISVLRLLTKDSALMSPLAFGFADENAYKKWQHLRV